MARLGVARRIDTAGLAIGGGRDFPEDAGGWIGALAARTGLPKLRVAALFERYGTQAAELAEAFGAEADIAGHSAAELGYLIVYEQVETLADLLLRRTTIAITGGLSLSVIDRSLELLAEAKGWTAERMATERRDFLDLLASRHGLSAETLSRRDQRSQP
jgi:glycerol-3-phosphate dehydrogenase